MSTPQTIPKDTSVEIVFNDDSMVVDDDKKGQFYAMGPCSVRFEKDVTVIPCEKPEPKDPPDPKERFYPKRFEKRKTVTLPENQRIYFGPVTIVKVGEGYAEIGNDWFWAVTEGPVEAKKLY